ncbi:hypothetical protein KSP40_PGU008121 [Platanthera guangdongensis]|uniref:VQ domain-containing protein n=1 Tax=Platanthera guangdongensis TaxID=2320717 RepID=A0ABR2LE64_9ASPA
MKAAMSGKRSRALKIVVIETQFVSTDSVHFKSVVQKLTGKDAVVFSGAAAYRSDTPAVLPEGMDGLTKAAEDEGRDDWDDAVRWQKDNDVFHSLEAKKEDVDFCGMSIEDFCSLWQF